MLLLFSNIKKSEASHIPAHAERIEKSTSATDSPFNQYWRQVKKHVAESSWWEKLLKAEWNSFPDATGLARIVMARGSCLSTCESSITAPALTGSAMTTARRV
jgi:hypothetical protein